MYKREPNTLCSFQFSGYSIQIRDRDQDQVLGPGVQGPFHNEYYDSRHPSQGCNPEGKFAAIVNCILIRKLLPSLIVLKYAQFCDVR